MSSVALPAEPGGPHADDDGVRFVLGDGYRRLARVRLQHDLGPDDATLTRHGTQWTVRIPRPPVDRMEYLFEVEDHNGHRTTTTDPHNPLRAPGAFGDKSVVEFAEYERPGWLDAAGGDGAVAGFAVEAADLGAGLDGTLWSAAGLASDTPAPLLVVHDGPEYAALGGFCRYLAASTAAGALPPLRAALVGPGERNDWYSANPAYADALLRALLPTLPPATVRIGVGVSLGALAMLHAHRTHPGVLDGLFLQSGSFFTPDLDGQESGFSGFGAVTEFVASVHESTRDDHPVPTAMTCGLVEENLANNQRMARALTDHGYPVRLHTVRDAHNYTAWRDALHPHLTALVRDVVAGRAA